MRDLQYALVHIEIFTGKHMVACTFAHRCNACRLLGYLLVCSWANTHTHACTHRASPGVCKPNVKQTYGDSPHDPLPNHVEQTETVASATTSNLLYMIYYTDTHRLSNVVCV